jgi:hypothetical protein
MSRQKPIILPLETADDVYVRAFPDDRDIQVCFTGGGFVRAGVFRHALDKGVPRKAIERGPVTILVNDREEPDLDVRVSIPRGGEVIRRLRGEVCDEIIERIDQARSLLHSYDFDEEAMDRVSERKAAKRQELAAAAV